MSLPHVAVAVAGIGTTGFRRFVGSLSSTVSSGYVPECDASEWGRSHRRPTEFAGAGAKRIEMALEGIIHGWVRFLGASAPEIGQLAYAVVKRWRDRFCAPALNLTAERR